MNNREFFDTLLINGKIDNLNKRYIRSLYDSKVYVGNLGRLVINKNMLKFVQVMDICSRVIQLDKDDEKSCKTLNKIEYLLRNYLKFTSFRKASEFISSTSTFLDYALQSKNNVLDGYLNYCKIVKYITDDELHSGGKRYELKQTYTSNKLRVFKLGEEIITPLIVIHCEEVYYSEENKFNSGKARIDKMVSLLDDKDLDLILVPYVEEEDKLLGNIFSFK